MALSSVDDVIERVNYLLSEAWTALAATDQEFIVAQALDELIASLDMPLDAVVNIDTSAEVVVERLSGRRTCKDCQTVYHVTYSAPKKAGVCDECGGELYQRDDDKEETIRKRLQVYQEQTAPLLDYYSDSGKMVVVSGDNTIDEVYDAICSALS